MVTLTVWPFWQYSKLISACHADCILVYFDTIYIHILHMIREPGWQNQHIAPDVFIPTDYFRTADLLSISHNHRTSATRIINSKMLTNGANMRSMSQCCISRESYCWFWTENPLRDFVRLGPIGKRPSRIHAWLVGLFRIPEGIFPKLIKIGHNFLSPEKFVKQVWSKVIRIGMRVVRAGRVICWRVSIL